MSSVQTQHQQVNKTCIILCGPTAVGKTALAVALAELFATEIISADSRQCYRELNIGVARPSPDELHRIKHHFIASHSIHEHITAADFEQLALNAVQDIFQRKPVAIVCGGTGLYIKAFVEGMDPIPAVDDTIRQSIMDNYRLNGLEGLQDEIKKIDPLYYASGEMQNPQRIMRALEVVKATGHSILSYQTQTKAKRDFNIIRIGVELPREDLYSRINERVGQMIDAGLTDEARSLWPLKHLNALQTVGYRELFDFFQGNISFNRAVELIKQNTRHYAKRQLTWFKKDPEISWCTPELNQVLEKIVALNPDLRVRK